MTRLKTITSYTGLVRWKRETQNAPGWLARCQLKAIRPLSHFTSIQIYIWSGTPCIYFKTADNCYGVYTVPKDMQKFPTQTDADLYHIAQTYGENSHTTPVTSA